MAPRACRAPGGGLRGRRQLARGLGVVVPFEPRRATRSELEIVHYPPYIERIEEHCLNGGGHLDHDTFAVPASFDAALRAAGAGLDAVERLRNGEGDSAFLAVQTPRPPRPCQQGDGLLPVQQRGRHRWNARRPR